MRYLCAVGDVTKISTWSGTPFFMLAAGKASGFLDGGLKLDVAGAQGGRALWNIGQLLTTAKFGGFQYSERFLERLFDSGQSLPREAEIISLFPLLPPPGRHAGPFSLYIDATLKQNFEDYGIGSRVAARFQADILAREKGQYQRAERIVTMSRWAARSVIGDYGIDPAKVHVCVPGANLPDTISAPETAIASRERLVLGFIGADWRRKRLDLMDDIASEMNRRGVDCQVLAIGPEASVGQRFRHVRSLGFIDKASDQARFCDAVRQFSFGCLLSDAEAMGISLLECLRLGVPVIGRDRGGIADAVPDTAGIVLPSQFTIEEACDRIETAWQASTYRAYQSAARAIARQTTWAVALKRMERIWDGDTAYCCGAGTGPQPQAGITCA